MNRDEMNLVVEILLVRERFEVLTLPQLIVNTECIAYFHLSLNKIISITLFPSSLRFSMWANVSVELKFSSHLSYLRESWIDCPHENQIWLMWLPL